MLVYMTPTFEKQVEELKRIGLENRKRYNAMSDEERLKLQEEYYREKHKPLTKAQRMICELEVSELILKAQSQPSELKTLRTENAILKKKLEEIKSIISS